MAASVAQAAFEVIREHMVQSNAAPVSKGKIVIATVKGDIHDIGKNIVKVLLENYGYDVIDLGKDVEYQAVVDAVRENDVKLVGLSALMTTTLVSMKKTIELLHENELDCKIMVGRCGSDTGICQRNSCRLLCKGCQGIRRYCKKSAGVI